MPMMPYGMAGPPPFGYHMPDPFGRRARSESGRGRKGKRKNKNRKRNASRSRKKFKCNRDPPEKVGENGAWEVSKEATGLKLIGELAPPGVHWEYRIRDESRRSFAAYLECPIPRSRMGMFFDAIKLGTHWHQPKNREGQEIPRKTAWMVASGCRCTYRYGGIEVQPQVFPQWMTDILALYMPLCGLSDPSQWPDSCNVNLYDDAECSVGWHSDDEALFHGLHQDIRIISLSFGEARKFNLRKVWPEEGEPDSDRMLLKDGDLCTMEGMLQKHYIHRVPKEIGELGPRINLTWRWVLRHSKACPRSCQTPR